jgi:hypothetical protein
MADPQGLAPDVAAPYAPTPEGFDELREVENQSLLWLVLGALGFWFGFGWLTGPLSWYFGARARNKYLALGRPPSGMSTAAWIVGIATTAVSYLLVALIVLIFLFTGVVVFSQL